MGANSMVRVKLPKCKPAHKPVLEAADARRLYFALPDFRDKLIFRMAVIWGPRTSELFGLTVDCWRGDHFEIQNTAYKGELRRVKVKTEDSFRIVPVPAEMRGMVERWIAEAGLNGTDVLFPGRDGMSPMWGNTWLQKHVQRVARQIGITVPITFQVLRRSFSTRHRNELKDAALVCGHSEETARRIYAQAVPQQRDASSRKTTVLFSPSR
jgi:integrase